MTTEANDQAGVAASRVAPPTNNIIKPTSLNPAVHPLPPHHPASSPLYMYYVMSSVPLSLTSCLTVGRW